MNHVASVDLAQRIRKDVLRMTHSAKASHIGSCFSVTDIIAVLYSSILIYKIHDPQWLERDRLIMSKGHAAATLYAALAEQGFFSKDCLETYGKNGTILQGHPSHAVPGVEISTGSLGHGLPIACGMALAAKHDGKNYRVFVILSDGECDEGSVWEAALFAAQHQLNNLTVIIDYNKFQACGRIEEILDLEPFSDKWRAFKWNVHECDGHDHHALNETLSCASPKPNVVIAHTIKGKGVSFMENQLLWHYRSPDDAVLELAMKEIECAL